MKYFTDSTLFKTVSFTYIIHYTDNNLFILHEKSTIYMSVFAHFASFGNNVIFIQVVKHANFYNIKLDIQNSY